MTFLNMQEAFFREAIESVLAQTGSDWELLLVDDGSTNENSEVAREYVRQDPARLRYLHHDEHRNLGMSASRNLALRHSRGEYIAFLDADDVWLPDKLERQIPILAFWPDAALTYWNTLSWYSWTGDTADEERDHLRTLGVPLDRLIDPPLLIVGYLLGRAAIPCMCSLLARRSAIQRVGGFEESFPGLYEDQVFYAKMMLAYPVVVSGGWKEKYRRHSDSCTSVADRAGQTYEGHERYLRWLEEYLATERMQGTYVWKIVQRRLWFTRHRRVERAVDVGRGAGRRIRRAPRRIAKRALPGSAVQWLKSHLSFAGPPVGRVRFGDLRRVTPISPRFGFDRGLPIDRHYIESFLERHAADVKGRVLEFGDDAYTRRFGGNRVTLSDVLHVRGDSPRTTIVADLARADHVPSDAFDCIICTQTLQLIFDVSAAIRTLHRILKPGGVLLVTVPGITQISRDEWGATWYWRFTSLSVRRLFEQAFSPSDLEVRVHGNVLVATAFLHGLATREITPSELAEIDPRYDVLITVRAIKGPPAS